MINPKKLLLAILLWCTKSTSLPKVFFYIDESYQQIKVYCKPIKVNKAKLLKSGKDYSYLNSKIGSTIYLKKIQRKENKMKLSGN